MTTLPWHLNLARPTLADDWAAQLAGEFQLPYMAELQRFLSDQASTGKTLFPPSDQVFRALQLTPFESVKVVILGQDPYHGPGQAHGLSFSVQAGIKPPPSLVNIYKELEQDVGISRPNHGDLSGWARQGVLLLNSVLTVEQGNAGAHQGKGWESFTDAVIERLNRERDQLVFMLWGSYAQKKGRFIDRDRHCVLQAPHPSPLSAHRGWFGSGHFSAANVYLRGTGQAPIDWQP
ncbi:uracil-DNA glycosylase [Saccharospirillum sp. MSK14-1]|uniref:uracil-DNA glycosylase n=1 Tax=Saccharospirillum sp. MSK14-1 TaxID=1897632 RepID=UPI000D35A8AA|nr:uracil-DNA glycosylase [Saccharospirillum sp. MSK14-1]PTY36144.1 uracil-DNA glycosylase [Saccharospirillum sp. MSK14-1]